MKHAFNIMRAIRSMSINTKFKVSKKSFSREQSRVGMKQGINKLNGESGVDKDLKRRLRFGFMEGIVTLFSAGKIQISPHSVFNSVNITLAFFLLT